MMTKQEQFNQKMCKLESHLCITVGYSVFCKGERAEISHFGVHISVDW